MKESKVKGTYDILPTEVVRWQALEKYISNLFKTYNYQEIRTPIMEHAQVFHRDDEFSDMVTKETYNFYDKGNRLLTLRPEGTAGIVRSYIENKLYAQKDVYKLWYVGPNFRYERPQKGRYRQFSQFGVEVLGSNDPYVDAEVIALAYEVIVGLGLKNVTVKINSVGDKVSKESYLRALIAYLEPFKADLSNDSQERFERNPLRILDSKDPMDQKILKEAPLPLDYLTDQDKDFFDQVTHALNLAGVRYEIDNRLVRGLDYYAQVVFEVHAEIEGFGAQNALGGGGRYNDLVASLGGPSKAGVGFAFGMERLLLALELESIELTLSSGLDVYFVTFDDQTKQAAFRLQSELRKAGLSVDLSYASKAFKGQFKEALSYPAKFVVIIGEDELSKGVVTIKNTETEMQNVVPMNEVMTFLKEQVNHE